MFKIFKKLIGFMLMSFCLQACLKNGVNEPHIKFTKKDITGEFINPKDSILLEGINYARHIKFITPNMFAINDRYPNEYFLNFFDAESRLAVAKAAFKGKGPNELQSLNKIIGHTDSIIYISDLNDKKIHKVKYVQDSLNGLLRANVSDYKSTLFTSKINEKKIDGALYATELYGDSLLVSVSNVTTNERYHLSDLNLNVFKSFGEPPNIESKPITDSIYYIAIVVSTLLTPNIGVSVKNQKIVIAYEYYPFIEIYDAQTFKKVKMISGFNMPYPLKYRINLNSIAIPCSDCLYGFSSLKCYEDSFFVLFSAKLYSDRGTDYCKYLLEFDYNGTLLNTFKLSKAIVDFDFSSSGELYGLSPDSEKQLLIYDID